MPFPDAEHAVVTQEKLRDDLLNSIHPAGGPKATWFASLGYTLENREQLRNDLLLVANSCDDFVPKASPFGVNTKHKVKLAVKGIDRRPFWLSGLLRKTHLKPSLMAVAP